MESIKYILNNNNIQLNFPDKILNLEFKGHFEFKDISLESRTDIDFYDLNYGQKCLVYWFRDKKTNKQLYLSPEDSKWTVEFGYYDSSKKYGWSVIFNINAEIVIKEPDYNNQWYYDRIYGDAV